MNRTRSTSPIPVDGGSRRAGCIPGSEAVDEREGPSGGRAERGRHLLGNSVVIFRARPQLSPGLVGITLVSGQIIELYVLFVAVSGASIRFPSQGHYSGERQPVGKNDAKIFIGIYTSPPDPVPATPRQDCSRPSCLIPRSAGPCRGAGARGGRGEGERN